MEEIWKPVPGYEGLYEASDQGRVRSLDRYCLGKDGRSEFHGGKILKPWGQKRGNYLAVTLRIGDSGKKRTVHRIIAETFLGSAPGMDVMHLDGNRQNNTLENLKYGSRKENLNQTYQYGGKQARGKLSIEDVHGIRKRLRAGENPVDIAKEYMVNSAAIYHIRNGTTFKWLPEEVT
jgi:hypothetical protein